MLSLLTHVKGVDVHTLDILRYPMTTLNSTMAVVSVTDGYVDNGTDTTVFLVVDNSSLNIAALCRNIFLVLAFVLNVFGNTTIIVSIGRFSWLKHNMYVALQTLAVADLLMFVPILLECIRQYTGILFPYIMSRFLSYIRAPLILGAAYHMILVAMERFIAVMFPFLYKAHVTRKRIWISSASTYLFAILVSIPDFLLNFGGYMNVTLSQSGTYIANSFSNLSGYFLLAFMLLFLHGKVTHVAKLQIRRVGVISLSSEGNGKKHGHVRPTEMMVIVVGVYLLLWTPFTISTIASLIVRDDNVVLHYLEELGLVLGIYNSSVNFIIYTTFNRKLRVAFRKVLRIGTNDEIEESTT